MSTKQSLEKLLAPFKFIDERIHRQYEKIGAELDKKGDRARYKTAFTLNMLSCIPFIYTVKLPLRGFIAGFDNGLNLIGMRGGLKSREDTSGPIVKDNPIVNAIFIMDRVLRSPLFIAGIGNLAHGLYELTNSALGSGDASDGLMSITRGFGLLGLSSSMYLKDKNPKILEKDSVYVMVKNAVSKFTSAPVPVSGYSK